MLLVFHRAMAYSIRFKQESLKTLGFFFLNEQLYRSPLFRFKDKNDVVDRARFHDQLSTCEPSASNIETQHSDLVEALNPQPHEDYEEMTLTSTRKDADALEK